MLAVNDTRPARPARSNWLRRASLALGAIVVAGALIHMPALRGMLMRFSGCPFASTRMTPAQMDVARGLALASRKGDVRAPARPALGFVLGTTSVEDIHRWASRGHLDCDDVRPGFVKCLNVPPTAVGRLSSEGRIDELVLGFDAQGRLANVTTLREHLDAAHASRSSTEIASYLRGSLGPAARQGGALDATSLAAPGALGLATVSYRYSNYMAELTAMNLPAGCSIREHYISSND